MFTRLLRLRPSLRRAAEPRPSRAFSEQADLGERPICGWLDSARDLRAGLVVMEHMTPAAVAQHLPLGWWLRD